jgi:hypothetical protein
MELSSASLIDTKLNMLTHAHDVSARNGKNAVSFTPHVEGASVALELVWAESSHDMTLTCLWVSSGSLHELTWPDKEVDLLRAVCPAM